MRIDRIQALQEKIQRHRALTRQITLEELSDIEIILASVINVMIVLGGNDTVGEVIP